MSFDIDIDYARAPKLPLWKTIRLSYATYFSYFPDLLRASWLWILLIAVTVGGASWLQLPKFSGFAGVKVEALGFIQTNALLSLSGLMFCLAGISIAVAWHRRLILGERPAFSGSNLATKGLWHYAVVSFVIFLLSVVPAIVISVPLFFINFLIAETRVPGAQMMAAAITVSAMFIPAAAIIMHLILILPARAVGHLRPTFRETWTGIDGNALRIFWGVLACGIPPILPLEVALAFVGQSGTAQMTDEATAIRMVSTIIFSDGYYLLAMPVVIGFLSHAYQHLFKQA